MKQIYLSPKELKAVKRFKQKIDQNYPVVDFKLFGSKVRGDFGEHSDIDLLLVLKTASEQTKDKIYDLVNEILVQEGVDLSVKIFPQKRFNYLNSIPSVFMQFIQKEAVSL